ncbi:MAG: four helix bundle protein [Ignavibacteria bacterium]|nr:four helix bundle protein [Ignavibacteria bacterium]
MSLDKLRIYSAAVSISNEVAKLAVTWDSLHRNTVGVQLVRSIDSISNNIAEGYSRVSTAEKLQFLFYAEASLQESKTQIRAASERQCITEEKSDELLKRLRALSISMMEFAAALLRSDTEYKGRYRTVVEKKRAWLVGPKKPEG